MKSSVTNARTFNRTLFSNYKVTKVNYYTFKETEEYKRSLAISEAINFLLAKIKNLEDKKKQNLTTIFLIQIFGLSAKMEAFKTQHNYAK